MYTTLKTSKQLKEWGCELESEFNWKVPIDNYKEESMKEFGKSEDGVPDIEMVKGRPYDREAYGRKGYYNYYPAYDIMNDICIKYAKEFFGEEIICGYCSSKELESVNNGEYIGYDCKECNKIGVEEKSYLSHTFMILALLQQGKQEEAEEYILEHCLFNN